MKNIQRNFNRTETVGIGLKSGKRQGRNRRRSKPGMENNISKSPGQRGAAVGQEMGMQLEKSKRPEPKGCRL